MIKINIPTELKDITLGQYMKYKAYLNANPNITDKQGNDKAISVFCNITLDQVSQLPVRDYKEILTYINGALLEQPKQLIMHYKGLSFIPSLDNITAGEYADLDAYWSEDESQLDKFINVLYRPRTTKAFDDYLIEKYDSDKSVSDAVYSMPMDVVKSALGFFLTLRNDLLNCTQKYIKQQVEAKTQQT
jgi:hypothetical protein